MVKPSKEAIFTGSQEGVLRAMIRSVKDKDFNSFQELPRVEFTEAGSSTDQRQVEEIVLVQQDERKGVGINDGDGCVMWKAKMLLDCPLKHS